MGIKAGQNANDSSKAVVGEIDTRAPFQSVKAAVSLFGEGAISAEKATVKKPKPLLTERILAKETQLHLAQKELNKFKEQLKNAETTRAQALVELEKAKGTVEDLSNKLGTINESKESMIKATETAKNQAKQFENANSGEPTTNGGSWKHELDNAREQYSVAITELNSAKQELWKIRQDFEASMDAKVSAFRQAEEAEHVTEANEERTTELSKEIASVQESLLHIQLASVQTQQERANILSEKDAHRQSCRLAVEETEKKLKSLKKEFDPELARSLEEKLAESTAEIGSLQKEMEKARVSDQDVVQIVTTELDDAKGTLQKVAEEESVLRNLTESLKQEIECLKKQHLELKEKEAEAESIAGNLHVKLRKSKAELKDALAREAKSRGASEDVISTLQQLSAESENARIEAETMKKKAEELKKEAESNRIALEEAEKNLQFAMKDAEEAKVAEAEALNQIKILSEKTNLARSSTSESGAQITISTEEYESLSRKAEESNKLVEMKVEAALAQVEAIKASENEALKKLEATQKEIEEMKASTEEALKRAEMAEAAKRAVEGEMRRWREREQKRAAEAATRILAETETSSEASPPRSRVLKAIPSEKGEGVQTMERTVTKKTLLPNLSGIFQRKKNQVEGGSPSYLPGEKPM
ncbi:WEB family protein At1g12150-like [Tasmannia lanceolata]|uniref:WEB family protein At1g12150-like n=1 Tax=Tasmannia lanceolata TaxID=3420 RepID=UPI0040631D3C